MKIHSVILRNYRGIKHQSIELSNTITVIEGPNEVGKSSITEALRLIRDVKSSSKSKDIRAVQPVGSDEVPQVEINLTTGPYNLEYFKAWGNGSGKTQLRVTTPVNAQYTGDEAHNRFREILEETLDLDLLTALDVVQGESLSQAQLAPINALQTALSSDESLESHDSLMARIKSEHSRYFTPSGRDSKEVRQINEKVTQLKSAVATLEEENNEIETLGDSYTEIKRNLTQLKDELNLAQRAHQEAERSVQRLNKLRDEVRDAEKALEDEKMLASQAKRETNRRLDLVADIATKHIQLSKFEEELSNKKDGGDKETEALNLAESDLAIAKDTRDSLTEELAAHEKRLQIVLAQTELAALDARVESARQSQIKITELETLIASMTITAEQVETLRDLDLNMRLAQTALRAAAASATVTPTCPSANITINGEKVVHSTKRSIEDSLTIEIPGQATIILEPGNPPQELQNDERNARAALKKALEQCETANLEAAQENLNAKEQQLRLLSDAKADLDRSLRDETITHLEMRMRELENVLRGSDLAQNGAGEKELTSDVTRFKELLLTAQKTYDTALTHYQHRQNEHQKCTTVIAQLEAKISVISGEYVTSKAQLGKERAEISDDNLNETLETSEKAVKALQKRCVEARKSLGEIDADKVEAQLKNCEQEFLELQRKLERTNADSVRIKAIIDHKESQGIYDRLVESQAELEAFSRKQTQLRKMAQALDLLLTTMEGNKNRAQESYIDPFKERIEALGKPIFGETFSVHVSRDLKIVSRTLGGTTLPFDLLSSGTREQLSLLGRLACAELIEPEDGAPLILDDTLGYSDPERLRAIGSTIATVSTRNQIIVLTCDPQRAETIEGAKVVRLRKHENYRAFMT